MQYKICPYSDDYMTFNEISGHYVLTEKAITDKCGTDIRTRLSDNLTVNPDTVINMLLSTVSDTVYAYIHASSAYPKQKDWLIAHSQELREVVQKAMEYQAVYFQMNGDLFMSTASSDDGKELSKLSKSILLNSGLLYSGV